jgi:hypothetical protein
MSSEQMIRNAATEIVIAPEKKLFLEFGEVLGMISPNGEESWVVDLQQRLAEGLVFSGKDDQPITVMLGHHRQNMDDTPIAKERGNDGPSFVCHALYQPKIDGDNETLPPMELLLRVDGQYTCIERLEWVKDCLRIVGEKAELGYFGDVMITGSVQSTDSQAGNSEIIEISELDQLRLINQRLMHVALELLGGVAEYREMSTQDLEDRLFQTAGRQQARFIEIKRELYALGEADSKIRQAVPLETYTHALETIEQLRIEVDALASSPVDIEKDRALYELTASQNQKANNMLLNFRRNSDGEYMSACEHSAWWGWQAGKRHAIKKD